VLFIARHRQNIKAFRTGLAVAGATLIANLGLSLAGIRYDFNWPEIMALFMLNAAALAFAFVGCRMYFEATNRVYAVTQERVIIAEVSPSKGFTEVESIPCEDFETAALRIHPEGGIVAMATAVHEARMTKVLLSVP
jgi:hypothetical protein